MHPESFCVGRMDSLSGSKPVPRALPFAIVHDFVQLPPSSSGTVSVVRFWGDGERNQAKITACRMGLDRRVHDRVLHKETHDLVCTTTSLEGFVIEYFTCTCRLIARVELFTMLRPSRQKVPPLSHDRHGFEREHRNVSTHNCSSLADRADPRLDAVPGRESARHKLALDDVSGGFTSSLCRLTRRGRCGTIQRGGRPSQRLGVTSSGGIAFRLGVGVDRIDSYSMASFSRAYLRTTQYNQSSIEFVTRIAKIFTFLHCTLLITMPKLQNSDTPYIQKSKMPKADTRSHPLITFPTTTFCDPPPYAAELFTPCCQLNYGI